MSEQWVILELSPKAEGEDPDIIRRSIRNTIRDAEVFVPASVTEVGEDKVVQYLVDGYAFVRRVHPDPIYFKLEGGRYVQAIVTHPSSFGARNVRQLSCIASSDIDRMRNQIQAASNQGISVGDTVRITSGAYKQILAIVIEDIPELDKVLVQVKLRSKESLVTLPRSFLGLVTKAPRPAYLDKAESLKSWFRMALALISWPNDAMVRVEQLQKKLARTQVWLDRGRPLENLIRCSGILADPKVLVERAQTLARLSDWVTRGQQRESLLCASRITFDLDPIRRKGAECVRMGIWLDRGNYLTRLLDPVYHTPDLPSLEIKYTEWSWLQDVIDRIQRVGDEVEAIGRVMAVRAGDTTVQNIVIDGHNLAFRCQYAPGMDTLADSKGRPTGIILGFIRSLVSLHKRYPDAQLYVCWDGSSNRRKKIFAEYKANRGERVAVAGFDQIRWLRDALPFFGVAQAYHDDEEADDVIATLIRGNLQGQRNVIFTTDRDMLQLVTDTDQVLVPAVGSRKEILYDSEAVLRDYGVPPSQMVMLRAFLGDSSDNIPGVPRVPSKVIVNLVHLYKTVDGVYGSNLAGLTKYQYEKLRDAEAQIRLNVRLMGLDICAPFVLLSPDADQKTATERLLDVEVKADPIVAALWGTVAAGQEVRRAHERICDSG